jgi:hypothetical protein
MWLKVFISSFKPNFDALIAVGVVVALVGSGLAVALSVHHWREALQELQVLKQEKQSLRCRVGTAFVRAKFMGWLCAH